MSNPASRMPPAWLARAQEMKAARVSQRKIADAVHAGHHAVKLWLKKYPPGTTPPSRDARRPAAEWEAPARQLRADGKSWEAVAIAVGVKSHTIRLAIDPVFTARIRKKQKMQRDGYLNSRAAVSARRDETNVEKPKASAGMLAAARFVNPDDRRAWK